MSDTISGSQAAARGLRIDWHAFCRLLPDIPHHRIGRHIGIDVHDLDRWIEKHRVQPGTRRYLRTYRAR